MLQPGIYERGIFGDLMLPGIACGVKKYILIFNTSLNSPPIYVVDPRSFNVEPDSEIPVVLAYNLSHYESMHPCTNNDVQSTVNLVNEYFAGRYTFERKDMEYLLTQPVKPMNTITDKFSNDNYKRENREQITRKKQPDVSNNKVDIHQSAVNKKRNIPKIINKSQQYNDRLISSKDIQIKNISGNKSKNKISKNNDWKTKNKLRISPQKPKVQQS